MQLDNYRKILKNANETGELLELRKLVAELSLPESQRKNKKLVKSQLAKITAFTSDELQRMVFKYIENIISGVIPALRDHSDSASNTVKMAQQVKYDVKPEIHMMKHIQTFLDEHADAFVLDIETV